MQQILQTTNQILGISDYVQNISQNLKEQLITGLDSSFPWPKTRTLK